MTFAEYVKDSKNIDWDFTNELACDAYKELNNPFDKYFAYRIPKNANSKSSIYTNASEFIVEANTKYGLIQDPDTSSILLQDIYKVLWPELVEQEFMLHEAKIQSDTMTSAQRSLNEIVESIIETEEEKKSRGRKKVSNLYCLELYSKNRDGFIDKLNSTLGLSAFIENYHTLGNYIAVPHLFNAARSGNFANHDYWDLTLQKIHEWYFEDDSKKENTIIENLLHHKGDREKCKCWLNYFGKGNDGWHSFIDSYYLKEFVDCEYKPVPFCKNHSWKNPKIENYSEFLENVTRMIKKRGEQMYEVIKSSSLNPKYNHNSLF